MSDLAFSTAYSIIYASTVAGFLFGLWNWKEVRFKSLIVQIRR